MHEFNMKIKAVKSLELSSQSKQEVETTEMHLGYRIQE